MGIKKCCGTCAKWKPEPRWPSKGICFMSKGFEQVKQAKEYCWGWKKADPWDIEKRGYKLE